MELEGKKGVVPTGFVENRNSSGSTLNAVTSYTDNQARESMGKDKIRDDNKNTVPFYKLFSFADSVDIILMILGSLGALGNGIALPLMTVLFGGLIQAFGGASDIHDVLGRVTKVS